MLSWSVASSMILLFSQLQVFLATTLRHTYRLANACISVNTQWILQPGTSLRMRPRPRYLQKVTVETQQLLALWQSRTTEKADFLQHQAGAAAQNLVGREIYNSAFKWKCRGWSGERPRVILTQKFDPVLNIGGKGRLGIQIT